MPPELRYVGETHPLDADDASLVLSLITDAVYVLDDRWRFVYVNPAAEALLQQSADYLAGRSLWDAFPGTVGSEIGHRYRAARRVQESVAFEVYYAPLDGIFDIRAFPAGERFVVCFRDVTEARRADAERIDSLKGLHLDAVSSARSAHDREAFVRGVLDALPAATAVIGPDGRIVNVNSTWDTFAQDNGGDPGKLGVGISYLQVCHAAAAAGCSEAAAVAAAVQAVLAGEVRQAHVDYDCSSPWQQRWFVAQIAPFGPGMAVVTHTDITERKRAEEVLTRKSSCDGLTGLANRMALLRTLTEQLSAAPPVAVLFCDLDGFRAVNNTLGHAGGDELLCQVADRLRPLESQGVFVSRQGGDEFVLVAASHSRAAALALAEQVLARLGQPYSVRAVPIRLSVSIGVAVDEGRATTAEALIQEADRAMYQAKSAGRAQVCLYDEAMQASAARREQLMAAVEEAVESHQLEVHYQPILDLTTMCTVGYEALLRWDHPLLGSVPPDTFIPLAETTGAVVALGGWVISQACAHVAELRLSTGDDLFVAINVSPRQLADPLFASAIQRELGRHDIPASAVVVEITETAAMTDLGAASAAVGRLRQLGLRVDLDDFGTGYSSLAYLRHLPVSGLKVDRSFVSALVESSGGDDRGAVTVADPIVPAIIQMAHALGIEVTAEGIETAEQLALLQGLGCDRGQGYLLGRPSPPPGAERPSTG